jgi:hypothetical protein
MSSFKSLLVVLIAGLLFGLPSAAHASCYNSSPSNLRIDDSPADADLWASEISTVNVTVGADCTLDIDPNLDMPTRSDIALVLLDTDNNVSTGSSDGADTAVGIMGGSDPILTIPVAGYWDDSKKEFSFSTGPDLERNGRGGFSSSFEKLRIMNPGSVRIRIISVYSTGSTIYRDYAPDMTERPAEVKLEFTTSAPFATPTLLTSKVSKSCVQEAVHMTTSKAHLHALRIVMFMLKGN